MTSTRITHAYNFGDVVYLVTDPDQAKRMVTGIMVKQGGLIEYQLTWKANITYHYDFEISYEKDTVYATSN